jgi:hypothetical protein
MPHNLAINSFLEHLKNEDESRQQQIRTYRAYYDGDPPTLMTDRQASYLNTEREKNFGVNVCSVIVDVMVERLDVSGFSVQDEVDADTEDEDGGESDTERIEKKFAEWFNLNRMDSSQNWVFQAALREAESFVIVSWDEKHERPKLSHDYAYDGTSGVKVHTKPGTHREIWLASKRWQVDESTARLNLYYDNRIEKYINKSGDSKFKEAHWLPYVEEDGATELVVIEENGSTHTAAVSWWTDDGTADGEPLGVPVIPFINRDNGTGRGLSEIDNAIPIQDGINKVVLDLLGAADYTGYQLYWTNGQLPTNVEVYPGAIIPVNSSEDENAGNPQVGVLPAGDMSGMITLVNQMVSLLAGITGTPQSRFTPAAIRPSAGTQRQEESALLAKVNNLHKNWGQSWEDVMRMSARVDSAFGDNSIGDIDDMIINTVWGDVDVRNEKEFMETLAIKREKLDIPKKQLWREAGYDAAEIEEMEEEQEAARADELEEQAAKRQANMTDIVLAMGASRNADRSGNGQVQTFDEREAATNRGRASPAIPDNTV